MTFDDRKNAGLGWPLVLPALCFARLLVDKRGDWAVPSYSPSQ